MKYFLQGTKETQFREVDKEEFVNAERLNGFYNTLGKPHEPATSGFTGMYHRGHVEFESTADFNVPQNRKAIGVALHGADKGEEVAILLNEEE